MPIKVFAIEEHHLLVWYLTGHVRRRNVLSAIEKVRTSGRVVNGLHDLVILAPGSSADVDPPDLQQIIDASIAAFPDRYDGTVRLACVAEKLNYGIARLFCALIENETRIDLRAFVFVNTRHALEWIGLGNHQIDACLVAIDRSHAH